MEMMEVRKYPDDNVLRQSCECIDEVTKKERNLFNKMLYTMRYFKGIGLAAPQVGLSKRIIVVEIEDNVVKLANPKIISKKGKDKMVEGCLSLPDTNVDVKRAYDVTVAGLNEKGEKIEINAKGLLARVIQHEIDHLDGKLIVDYMNFLKKWKYKRTK